MSGGAVAEFCFEARTGAVIRAGMAARCGIEALRSLREASLAGARAVQSAMRAAVKERADRLLALAEAGEVDGTGEGMGGGIDGGASHAGAGVVPPRLPRGSTGSENTSAIDAANDVRRRAQEAAELSSFGSSGWAGGTGAIGGASKQRDGDEHESQRLKAGFRKGGVGGASTDGSAAGDYSGLAKRAADSAVAGTRRDAGTGQVASVRRGAGGSVSFQL